MTVARRTCMLGVLHVPLCLLLVSASVSSEQGCCRRPLSKQAFVAPPTSGGVGLSVPSDLGGGLLARSPKRRHHRRQLLPPLLGPDGSHDSLGWSPSPSPSPSPPNPADKNSNSSGSRRPNHSRCRAPCRGVAGPAPWTRRASLLAAAAAHGRGEEMAGAATAGRRRERRRGGRGRGRGRRRSYRRGGEWRRLAAAGAGGDGGEGGGEGGRYGWEDDAAAAGMGSAAGAPGEAVVVGGGGGEGGVGKGGKENGGGWVRKRWRYAIAKIKKEPLQILTIPVSAACVGWITNKLAVEMIFHPLVWRGIPLRVIDGQPLGLFGWQGIVPAKAGVMAERMVDMVTTQLVDVEQVFRRLSPGKIARLLGPEIDSIAQSVYEDLTPKPLAWLPGSFGSGLVPQAVDELKGLRRNMLVGITKDMQKQVTQVLDLKEMVVGEMLRDRSLMVSLFQRCGKAEFKFLVNSGFFFGFLLGVVQMFVWLLYDKPWTLPAGGAVVGYITNWLAIKLIFEPVDPVKLGPFVLQGLFLKRQDEVAADFAEFFSSNVLTSNKLWKSIIDGSGADAFRDLVAARVVPFVSRASAVAGANLDPVMVKSLALRAAAKLGDHVHVLHDYTDNTLALRETMTLQMQKMSTRTFEGVLHPVFQEEETTLIIAGAILGAIAGFLQMLLSTKGVRDAAKKAAALAAEKASAAADGVVGAGGGLVGGVGAPVQAGAQAAQAGAQAVQAGAQAAQAGAQAAQKTAAGLGQRTGMAAKRRARSARDVAVTKYRWLSEAGRAAAAAVADRYRRRRRRHGGGDNGPQSEGSSGPLRGGNGGDGGDGGGGDVTSASSSS